MNIVARLSTYLRQPPLLLYLSLLFVMVPTAWAQTIRIGPYLQNATSSSIVIMWETSTGDESRVDYGVSDSLGSLATGTAVTGSGSSRIHTVELSGLAADTVYHYQVTTQGASSDIHHFRTMPTGPEANSNFVVYSDMQEQGAAPTNIHGRIIRESMTHHIPLWTGTSDMTEAVDFVLVPGDLVDSGPTYSDWQNQFFDEAQPLIQQVPYFTALGNHEQNHQTITNLCTIRRMAPRTMKRGGTHLLMATSKS